MKETIFKTKEETIDSLLNEAFKDKERIKQNFLKWIDCCMLEHNGYRLSIKLEKIDDKCKKNTQ